MTTLGPQTLGELATSTTREWLLTDGLGGYASGTVGGLRTRRYHGLLVVPVDGPARRCMGLVALDPVLVVDDIHVRLAVDEWSDGVVDPRGDALLRSFDLVDGVPRWRWQFGDIVLEREVAMAPGTSSTTIVHRLVASPRPVRLELTALCTWRDVHGERHAGDDPIVGDDALGFTFEDAYRVTGPGWTRTGEWYRGVHAREEAARGLAADEDLWAAGTFATELTGAGATLVVTATVSTNGSTDAAPASVSRARSRSADLLTRAGLATRDATTPIGRLVLAADRFIVTTPDGPTVDAGYPWFGEWSRDAMISFEGLFLCTGRFEEGAALLRRAAATVSDGMLMNTTDGGDTAYNTIDAALWFVHAVGRYVETTGDDRVAAELLPAVLAVIDGHRAGTRYGIGVDEDGLVRGGVEGVALTWMDARIDGRAVTPRIGKPVEIQALWIAALGTASMLATRARRDVPSLDALRDTALASFHSRFVRTDGLGLFDVVDGPDGDDASIRPNQVIAVGLRRGPFELDPVPAVARAVVEVCGRHLLTPVGLRSLSPTDPAYRGRHRGDAAQRDAAYHQGTVWPWLLGPWADACRRVGEVVDTDLTPPSVHLDEFGLGSVSETADGDAPHGGTGAPFQAWSVAEWLRVMRTTDPTTSRSEVARSSRRGRLRRGSR